MACCSETTGVFGQPVKAVISCFVKNGENMYAIVCKHARNVATQGIFVKDKSGIEIEFAKTVRRKHSGIEVFTRGDIDLIQVLKSEIHCKPEFRNSSGKVQTRIRIFDGKVEELFDETVFMCIKSDTGGTYTSKTGTVLRPPEIEDLLTQSYNTMAHVFVGNKDENIFADEGDSGRVVFRETHDGSLELIGIVLHKNKNCTICYLLRSGLDLLYQVYNLKLSLCESADYSSEDRGDITVEPGDTALFKDK